MENELRKNDRMLEIFMRALHGEAISMSTIMYLMSQGSWGKILEPDYLIDDIKEECEMIMCKY